MRYIGLALIILAVAVVTYSYRARLFARVSTLEAYLALAMHIRSRVSGYLEPPSVWAESFSSENGDAMALALRVRGGEMPGEAYLSLMDGLLLSEEAKEMLGTFFSRLGSGGLESEREGMDSGVNRLSVLLEKERDDCAQRGRIAAVMALMLSCGGAILMI